MHFESCLGERLLVLPRCYRRTCCIMLSSIEVKTRLLGTVQAQISILGWQRCLIAFQGLTLFTYIQPVFCIWCDNAHQKQLDTVFIAPEWCIYFHIATPSFTRREGILYMCNIFYSGLLSRSVQCEGNHCAFPHIVILVRLISPRK